MMRFLLALSLASLLAGCATTTPTTTTPVDAGGDDALAPGSSTAPSIADAHARAALHMTPEGGFADASPSTESKVPLTTPLNSPFTADYPEWSGATTQQLPARGNVTFRVFVTASSASLAANTFPVFSDLPGMDIVLAIGSWSVEASTPAPTLVRAGEIVELVVTVPYEADAPIPAGTAVSFVAGVYYTHVVGAAEFHYVLGGSHATRVEIG